MIYLLAHFLWLLGLVSCPSLSPDSAQHQPAEHPGGVPGLQASSASPTGARPAGLRPCAPPLLLRHHLHLEEGLVRAVPGQALGHLPQQDPHCELSPSGIHVHKLKDKNSWKMFTPPLLKISKSKLLKTSLKLLESGLNPLPPFLLEHRKNYKTLP